MSIIALGLTAGIASVAWAAPSAAPSPFNCEQLAEREWYFCRRFTQAIICDHKLRVATQLCECYHPDPPIECTDMCARRRFDCRNQADLNYQLCIHGELGEEFCSGRFYEEMDDCVAEEQYCRSLLPPPPLPLPPPIASATPLPSPTMPPVPIASATPEPSPSMSPYPLASETPIPSPTTFTNPVPSATPWPMPTW